MKSMKTKAQSAQQNKLHEFDEQAICIHCGFDGAEWHWWKHHAYEGKASENKKMPLCNKGGFWE